MWQTDKIVRIAPADGQVTGWIDLAGLLSPVEKAEGADSPDYANSLHNLAGTLIDAGDLPPHRV